MKEMPQEAIPQAIQRYIKEPRTGGVQEIIQRIEDLAVRHLENGPYENEAYQAVTLCREIMRLCAEAKAEKNDPLTLDELREMDGEPVWLASIGEDFDDGWYIIVSVDRDRLHCLQLYVMLFFEHYGKTWLAYRRKPKEGMKCLK